MFDLLLQAKNGWPGCRRGLLTLVLALAMDRQAQAGRVWRLAAPINGLLPRFTASMIDILCLGFKTRL